MPRGEKCPSGVSCHLVRQMLLSKKLNLNLNHYHFHGRGSRKIAGVVKLFDWRPGGQMNPSQPCGNQNRSATEPAWPAGCSCHVGISQVHWPRNLLWFLNNFRSVILSEQQEEHHLNVQAWLPLFGGFHFLSICVNELPPQVNKFNFIQFKWAFNSR